MQNNYIYVSLLRYNFMRDKMAQECCWGQSVSGAHDDLFGNWDCDDDNDTHYPCYIPP